MEMGVFLLHPLLRQQVGVIQGEIGRRHFSEKYFLKLANLWLLYQNLISIFGQPLARSRREETIPLVVLLRILHLVNA